MKNLYVMSKNNGDGSSSVVATFNKELIDEMEQKYNEGELDSETWGDGDGFHYQTWTVPDECTAKSMKFYEIKREDVFWDE